MSVSCLYYTWYLPDPHHASVGMASIFPAIGVCSRFRTKAGRVGVMTERNTLAKGSINNRIGRLNECSRRLARFRTNRVSGRRIAGISGPLLSAMNHRNG